jgi:hypothetical protein
MMSEIEKAALAAPDADKAAEAADTSGEFDFSFGAKSRAARILRETLAATFWIYSIAKVFFFDIDRYLSSSYFPSLHWVRRHSCLG